jgi:hypothetical protein
LWRHGLLAVIIFASFLFYLCRQPFGQDLRFHDFADQRTFFGIPNFFDVVSNLPFLFVGIGGLWLGHPNRLGAKSMTWKVFFAGVALVSLGSGYYHWQPNNQSLVWDRLPMTIAFMALFVALCEECISEKLAEFILFPALLVGFSSVMYWHWFDDLRFYRWVQVLPLLTVPVIMVLFRTRYSHQWLLLVALGFYVLAKVSEAHDRQIFELTGEVFGGHALKHLLAAIGCFTILEMLRRRTAVRPLGSPPGPAQPPPEANGLIGIC